MFERIENWIAKTRRDREALFDDWLLNDALQSAWRARVLAVLSVIFVFFSIVNGGVALKTYFGFPEYQVWQYRLLIASSWYWGILMAVGWWFARHKQEQKTVYIMLVLFLIGPTGFGGIGIKGFGTFYNMPLLVLSIIFVSLLSKPAEQQRLIGWVVVGWSGFILFQYFFDEAIRTPIPPLMKAIGPGALASTALFYVILILQFYRLSVPNKILMAFMTGLQAAHQAIMSFMGTRLVPYMSYPAFVEFMEGFQYLLYFLIGAITLAMLFVTRAISNPLTKLTATAVQVKEGDLKVRADLTTIDEIGELAKVFNQVISRLSGTLDNLEQTVEERTRDLNVAAQVSKQITKELRLEDLLSKLVEETKVGFDLYFTSVYLFNPDLKQLTLAAGTGEAGVRMKADGRVYNIHDKRSIISCAAHDRTPVVISDLPQSGLYNANPYLPNTRSKVAIPMIIQDELVGVLGVQSIHPNDFSEADVRILTSLAEQIAVAVRNAELYENQIHVTEELKQLDEMKNQFLASVSHELRTPLNAIINYVAMVSDGMMGDVNGEQKELLDGAVKSSRHLLHLINDVLDISKIQAGKLELFLENDVDVRAEIETSIGIASAMIMGKPLEIHMDVPTDLPLISADKRRVRQILLNVLSNAVKFTDEGTIILRAGLVQHELIISIADSGPGISPAAQSVIFERFTQTEDGAKREGTGLGLPISRTLANLHGGRLWVESELGHGATFHLALPLKRSDPQ